MWTVLLGRRVGKEFSCDDTVASPSFVAAKLDCAVPTCTVTRGRTCDDECVICYCVHTQVSTRVVRRRFCVSSIATFLKLGPFLKMMVIFMFCILARFPYASLVFVEECAQLFLMMLVAHPRFGQLACPKISTTAAYFMQFEVNEQAQQYTQHGCTACRRGFSVIGNDQLLHGTV